MQGEKNETRVGKITTNTIQQLVSQKGTGHRGTLEAADMGNGINKKEDQDSLNNLKPNNYQQYK